MSAGYSVRRRPRLVRNRFAFLEIDSTFGISIRICRRASEVREAYSSPTGSREDVLGHAVANEVKRLVTDRLRVYLQEIRDDDIFSELVAYIPGHLLREFKPFNVPARAPSYIHQAAAAAAYIQH